MGEAIAFYFIAACILGFAVLVVTTKDTVHSVLFLVLDFLFVAALYVLLSAQFLAVIQILVYAGGIVVLYLFVVMLVNLKRPAEAHSDPRRKTQWGFALSVAVLAQLEVPDELNLALEHDTEHRAAQHGDGERDRPSQQQRADDRNADGIDGEPGKAARHHERNPPHRFSYRPVDAVLQQNGTARGSCHALYFFTAHAGFDRRGRSCDG